VETERSAMDFEKKVLEETKALPIEDGNGIRESQDTRRDYTGATAKKNPAEIKLVRKLDARIMVRIDFCFY
jgi:hypothetical protein